MKNNLAKKFPVALWFSTALIAAGVVGYSPLRLSSCSTSPAIESGRALAFSFISTQAVLIALLLALVGLAMAIYLVSVHGYASLHPENNKEILGDIHDTGDK
jgi:hypothetical protein